MEAIQTTLESCKSNKLWKGREVPNNFQVSPWFNEYCDVIIGMYKRYKRNDNITLCKLIIKREKVKFVILRQQ
jgi:hypothetical protein